MTRMLNALARRRPAADPARETMRTFVRTLARLAAAPREREGAR